MSTTGRVLLLIPVTSYRAGAFLAAARRLDIEVIVGSNHRPVLQEFSGGRTVALDFAPLETGVAQIIEHVRHYPVLAVIGTDDATTVLAATAAQALGLTHNAPQAVQASRDKYLFRQTLAQAAMPFPAPWFRLVSLTEDPAQTAATVHYPCVLKPLSLSASRGVIRVDDEPAFCAAYRRIAAILTATGSTDTALLAEEFIAGREVALEGLLHAGRLQLLALFDKPDPLDGPFFEETIYVTPSRLPRQQQQAVMAHTTAAAAALGLHHGPLHAELRVNEQGVWMIEIAARPIGGLCSRTLVFARGATQEELILRQALGDDGTQNQRDDRAAGVMMIPIPAAGRLRAITGVNEARSIAGIEDIVISIAPGEELVPLPEGDRYLGFIFARGSSPELAEDALRAAHHRLSFEIT